MDIKELCIDHPYYCSESNYFSNNTLRFETMTGFLDDFMDMDIDLNLCFRWDVKEKEDENENKTGKYRAEIFLILQRKGIFLPVMVNSFSQHEVDRFVEYLKSHKITLDKMWSPLC